MANSPSSLLSEGLVVADSYEIEHLLGRGGMGEVWLARHRRLAGKQVAVKVLRTGGALGPDQLARFRREAEIAARLEHPNIVQVLDFNTLPTGEPFLVMEVLKGDTLSARLKHGPLPLDQARAIVRQVGSALQAAHAAGIVHRDLKPENIFLLPTALGDQVKVLDFGISKLTESSSLQTTDSVLIGTPLYMSPEQATGHNREITPQSDLFSLGSICYEMLAGHAPFSADNIAKVVFRIAYEPHPPLAQAAPNLPASVIAAVEHALVKDRAQRTPDIDTFVLEFTGQAMSNVARDSARGLYKPGTPVTESMLGGATVTPQTGRLDQRATPGPPPAPTAPPRAEKRVSRRALFGVLAGAFAAATATLVVVLVPPENVASDPDRVVTFSMVVMDAGVAPEPPDAALALLVLTVDAGPPAPTPDAGQRRAAKVEPTSPEDAESLTQMRALERASKWDELYDGWSARALTLKSGGGKRQAFLLVGLAACHRHDQEKVKLWANRLENAGEDNTAAELKHRCVKVWDSFNE